MLIEKAGADTSGFTVYDDGVARAAELGPNLYCFQAGGHTVEFDLNNIAEAAGLLSRKRVGTSRSVIEAARTLLAKVEERLPADG